MMNQEEYHEIEGVRKLLLHQKPCKILVKLGDQDSYASQLSVEVDATYSHTVKILQRMEKAELVEFEKQGRKKIVSLTEKGERHADILTPLFRVPV